MLVRLVQIADSESEKFVDTVQDLSINIEKKLTDLEIKMIDACFIGIIYGNKNYIKQVKYNEMVKEVSFDIGIDISDVRIDNINSIILSTITNELPNVFQRLNLVGSGEILERINVDSKRIKVFDKGFKFESNNQTNLDDLKPMSESLFWGIIESSNESLIKLELKLEELFKEQGSALLLSFEWRLQMLLDKIEINRIDFKNYKYFSDDTFIYTMCGVILNGYESYQKILNQKSIDNKDHLESEELLYITDKIAEKHKLIIYPRDIIESLMNR